MPIIERDKKLNDLVAPDAEAKKIATGYQFTEGPVWHSREQTLTFSDVHRRPRPAQRCWCNSRSSLRSPPRTAAR